MKKILKISVFLALLAGIFLLLGFMRGKYDEIECRDINIHINYHRGDTLITPDELKDMIIKRFDTLYGKQASELKLTEMRNLMLSNPYIASCDVDFMLNGTLRIRASQRKPMIRIISSNQSWYVDNQGVVMPRKNNFSANVPVISGHLGPSGQLKTGNNLVALADTNAAFARSGLGQAMILAMYLNERPEFYKMIEQININQSNDLELYTYLRNHRIVFGKAENMDHKFGNLLSFYRSHSYTADQNQYKTISLKYNNQVVCSKR